MTATKTALVAAMTFAFRIGEAMAAGTTDAAATPSIFNAGDLCLAITGIAAIGAMGLLTNRRHSARATRGNAPVTVQG